MTLSRQTSITILSSSEEENEDVITSKPIRKKRRCKTNQADNANANADKDPNTNTNNHDPTPKINQPNLQENNNPNVTKQLSTPPANSPANETNQTNPSISLANAQSTINSSSTNPSPNSKSLSKRKRHETTPNTTSSPTQHTPLQPSPTPNRNNLLWSIPAYTPTHPLPPSQSAPTPPTRPNQQRPKPPQLSKIPSQEVPPIIPTHAPNSTWTSSDYISFALTAEKSFPFSTFSTKHQKPPSEINEVFSALIQMPAILASRAPNLKTPSKNQNIDIVEARLKDLRAKIAEGKKISEREMRDFLKKEIREGIKEGVRKAKEREKVRKKKRKAKAAVARELEIREGGGPGGKSRRKKGNGVLSSALGVSG
ncbi:MAG: hypothetical protein M1812_007665 [Candelaria pacifica]|nr:MAG: hypothetical protein M1812_007665 [Candelaria pacifica]